MLASHSTTPPPARCSIPEREVRRRHRRGSAPGASRKLCVNSTAPWRSPVWSSSGSRGWQGQIHSLPLSRSNARIRSVTDESRSIRPSSLHGRDEQRRRRVDRRTERAARDCANGQRGRLRAPDRARPLQAPGPLLSQAGRAGRRGRPAGSDGPRLEEPPPGSRGAALCARGSTESRRTRRSTDPERPKRILPVDYGPPANPDGGVGEPLVGVVLDRALPGRDARIEDGCAAVADARYEQERVGGARLRRGSCSCCRRTSARSHPPRGAGSPPRRRRTLSTPASPPCNSALQRAGATIAKKSFARESQRRR